MLLTIPLFEPMSRLSTSLMSIAIVLRREFSRYLRHQRSVATRYGKLVNPKGHKYVENSKRETPEIKRLSTIDAAFLQCSYQKMRLFWGFQENSRKSNGIIFRLDINEYSSNPCANNGVCIDFFNDYSCICVAGYTGENCTIGTLISCSFFLS